MGTADVEVLKGVEPGEEIVTGNYKALRTLKNNAKLKVDNRPTAAAAGTSWP
jgi:HlyD family secretion protein